MTTIIDGSAGITFPNGSNPQAAPSKVLQVVQATYGTAGSVTGTSAVASGLSATITPLFNTSKILVMVSQQGIYITNVVSSYAVQSLYRGSNLLITYDYITGYVSGGDGGGSCSTIYLDSPATTSPTTYSTKIANNTTGTTNWNIANDTTSTMILMEVAA
jgi:hypothetical protein